MEADNIKETKEVSIRPWILSILCIVFFVHTALLSVLFLMAAFFNSWLTDVINNYMEGSSFEKTPVLLFTITGFILYSISFVGTYYIWQMKKKGLVILFISVFSILLFTFIIGAGSVLNYLVYLFLLALFSLFYKRLG